MSETILAYNITYVKKRDNIDQDNYNRLVYAVFGVADTFTPYFEEWVRTLNEPMLYNFYVTYKNILKKFKDKFEQTLYRGEYLKPFYTYHHSDLRDLLLLISSALSNLFMYMEMAGITVPDEAKTKNTEASSILIYYRRLRRGITVEPEDHNHLLEALKKIYDVLIIMGFLCGRYGVTKYGNCLYC